MKKNLEHLQDYYTKRNPANLKIPVWFRNFMQEVRYKDAYLKKHDKTQSVLDLGDVLWWTEFKKHKRAAIADGSTKTL